jgi:hypothetical protein
MRTIRTRQYSCLPSVPADRDKIVSVDGLIDWVGCTRARGGRSGLVPRQATFALLMMVLSRLSWALRFRQAM